MKKIGLQEDEEHIIPLDAEKKTFMQATLIDANHCPGACMFLLKGYFGTYIHTGDFRFDPSMLNHPAIAPYVNLRTEGASSSSSPILLSPNETSKLTIDHLFLDDTFADPAYSFPTRV